MTQLRMWHKKRMEDEREAARAILAKNTDVKD